MSKKNIILLLLDGVRQDYISTSPELSDLMKQGTYFRNMISHAPYTLTSMAAIFSGMYGGRSGVDAYNKMFQYKKNCKFMAEYLHENSYYTVGDSMRLSLCPDKGFDKLTDHDESSTDYVKAHSEIIENLGNKNKQPFFLYLHYPTIHTKIVDNVFNKYDDFSLEYFDNHRKNRENYKKYLKDAGLYAKKIISQLRKHGLLDNTLLLLMADHGMGTGEKVGERAYGVFTYDYSIQSFAVLIDNDRFPSGKVIDTMVRTVDILPTILEYLEIPIDKNYLKMHGESLFKLFDDKVKPFGYFFRRSPFPQYSFSETGGLYGPWPSPDKPNVQCIRGQEWKLIHNCTPDTWELYNLKNDPHENLNLYEDKPEIVKKLRTEMNKITNNY